MDFSCQTGKNTMLKLQGYIDTIFRYYTQFSLIGMGSYGEVFCAKNKTSGDHVAVKIISKTTFDSNTTAVQHEIDILRKFRGQRGIVQLKNYMMDKNGSHYLIFELANMGTLENFIRQYGCMTEVQARGPFRQLAKALAKVHSKDIVHLDVKTQNVLLSCDRGNGLSVILGDFGMAKSVPKGTLFDRYCGSPVFVAPEVISGIPYDGYLADVWSLGVTLYIMIFGKYPFVSTIRGDIGAMVADLYLHIQKSNPDFSGKNISNELRDLLQQLLEKDPQKRIALNQVLLHTWLVCPVLTRKSLESPRRKFGKLIPRLSRRCKRGHSCLF